MAMAGGIRAQHESTSTQMEVETYPSTKSSARPFFRRVVHAAYFQVYNVRGDFGIVRIYGIFAVGIFRLQGNVNKAARQKKAYEYKRTRSDLG